ncbi:MAG: small basic family protein [Anaerolineae bacterium]|nr:small basic family protein [Anaerolineae bacterium]
MWLPLIGLLLGLIIGSIFSITLPAAYTRYTALAILASLDSVLGALRADMQGEYDNWVFISGFFVNGLLAALLTLLGDRLGVELYYAAIVAFGVRLFNNLAVIRRLSLERLKTWWKQHRTPSDIVQ